MRSRCASDGAIAAAARSRSSATATTSRRRSLRWRACSASRFTWRLRPATSCLIPSSKRLRRVARDGATVRLFSDPRRAVEGVDAVYTDVWASMGEEAEAADRRRIFAPYQVNAELMAAADPNAIFMHCLPAHRGEEVTSDVIDSASVGGLRSGRESTPHAEGAAVDAGRIRKAGLQSKTRPTGRMPCVKPWLAHYDDDVPATLVPYPDRTLVDYLTTLARDHARQGRAAVQGQNRLLRRARRREHGVRRGAVEPRRSQGRPRRAAASQLSAVPHR